MACSLTPDDPMSKLLVDNKTSSWPTQVPPLEDENLLQEILIRLPPKPSSLPRASLICTRWHNILSDPKFIKRYRKHHHKPPLLGFFAGKALRKPIFTPFLEMVFTPVLEPPDRIPSTRFSVPESCHSNGSWIFMGCRHGLAVLVHRLRREIVVWDPLTGQQHRVTFPAILDYMFGEARAEVLCADAEDGHVHGDCFSSPFKLVLIWMANEEAWVSLYDSTSGLWVNVVSMATHSILRRPSILVRNALFWSTNGGDTLVYDIERQTLGMIEKPVDSHLKEDWSFQLLRMTDGGLGLAVLSKLTVQLWERKSDFDGVIGWVLLQKTIQLEGILPWGLYSDYKTILFVGYDEDTNAIVLSMMVSNFVLQLDSMEIKHIIERENKCDGTFYPYTNFYTAGELSDGWIWNHENMISANVLSLSSKWETPHEEEEGLGLPFRIEASAVSLSWGRVSGMFTSY